MLGWSGGVAGFGGGEISGVRFWRGAGPVLESRSGSDPEAVASSALNSEGCGEGLFFFVFAFGGDIAGLVSWALS